MTRDASVAIVGGGLAGLVAAWRLERQGVTVVLIEAGERLGGRIESPTAAQMGAAETLTDDSPRFDLGATWFWPSMQPALSGLIEALGLPSSAQHESGDMLVERSPHVAPQRVPGYATGSMRLDGGMAALVEAVRARLHATRIVTGETVRRIRRVASGIELDATDTCDRITTYRAGHVLLALPPRLAAATIAFEPALPRALAIAWRDTATWMAPHAKYLAVYDTPFWREAGLSGAARSAGGPLAELHDASPAHGAGALFGFFGVPARTRSRVADAVLREQCRAQLVRLFGAEAATPRAEAIRDWARLPAVATAADQDGGAGHGIAPPAAVAIGPWQGCLTGIASEWSPRFPGYVAGAVEAAERGVHAWLDGVGRAPVSCLSSNREPS